MALYKKLSNPKIQLRISWFIT